MRAQHATDQEDAMSQPLIPAKPAEITLDTLPQLFAHHRAVFGGFSMTATPPEPDPPAPTDPPAPVRPEGITDEEWAALGDPGRAAIVREREARQAAERALAASRARPAPPKPDPPKDPAKQDPPKPSGDPQQIDVEAIVARAVAAAVAPFTEREEQREADQAAGRVRDAVLDAAKSRFHDATDALAGIDLTTVIDDHGQPDGTKIGAAINDLLTRKPHLGKVVDDRRFAQPGAGPTPGGSTPPMADRVKDTLQRMQERAGVKFADNS